MANALAVALGGAAGALLRYLVGLSLNRESFPWGTLLVNLLGSLLIGLFVALAVRQKWAEPWQLFAVTGVLGGFTTFSAFSIENLRMVQEGRIGMALAYGLGSIIAGLALAWVGMSLLQQAK